MTKKFFATVAICLALSPAAMADPFKVKVDETVTLKLNQAANSVVVGNATVADVTVHDARTLLVTGKAFGSTNLTVLDRAGNTIYTSQLTVGGEDDNGLTIVRSGATYSYSCVDKCRATPMVGDAPGHFSDVMATVSGKQATARGGN
ncbi:MAG TPA: pilus assembly protein N-terminal domain-containing protein [Hyphomonadaceae bacterium]|nr:pilus assembly protein N-terminal domain-containing protein [Hyphomonadaceae bacterium]